LPFLLLVLNSIFLCFSFALPFSLLFSSVVMAGKRGVLAEAKTAAKKRAAAARKATIASNKRVNQARDAFNRVNAGRKRQGDPPYTWAEFFRSPIGASYADVEFVALVPIKNARHSTKAASVAMPPAAAAAAAPASLLASASSSSDNTPSDDSDGTPGDADHSSDSDDASDSGADSDDAPLSSLAAAPTSAAAAASSSTLPTATPSAFSSASAPLLLRRSSESQTDAAAGIAPPAGAFVFHSLQRAAPSPLLVSLSPPAAAASPQSQHCLLTFGPSIGNWQCESLSCTTPRESCVRPALEPHFYCMHHFDLCATCASIHASSPPAVVPLPASSALLFDAYGRETITAEEYAAFQQPPGRYHKRSKPTPCQPDSICRVFSREPVRTHPDNTQSNALCARFADLHPLMLDPLCVLCSCPQDPAHVLYATRCSWYKPTDPSVLLSTTLLPDVQLSHERFMARLSVLWLSDPERLTKSLTCSRCGINARAYWSCSDEGCHISLCPRCWSCATYPEEQSLSLPPKGTFALCAPSSCRSFRPPIARPPFHEEFAAGSANDRSHVHIPFASVTILGFGDDQPHASSAAATYTQRSSALAQGFGVFPFSIRFSPTASAKNKSLDAAADDDDSIQYVESLLHDTRAEKLVLDFRCHAAPGGYDFSGRVYNAHDIVNKFILPLARAFLSSRALNPSLTKPSSAAAAAPLILVLFHCCDTTPTTWQTLLRQLLMDHRIALEFVAFSTPFLVFDTGATLPYLLPPWSNRLETRSTAELLRAILSTDFRSEYHPSLLSPSPITGADYQLLALAPPDPPGGAAAASTLAPAPPIASRKRSRHIPPAAATASTTIVESSAASSLAENNPASVPGPAVASASSPSSVATLSSASLSSCSSSSSHGSLTLDDCYLSLLDYLRWHHQRDPSVLTPLRHVGPAVLAERLTSLLPYALASVLGSILPLPPHLYLTPRSRFVERVAAALSGSTSASPLAQPLAFLLPPAPASSASRIAPA
jgi:hypothetical protein